MTEEDLQRERNKRNAKKSRKKKKDYIETLEKKVADLEEKLKQTSTELAQYKAKEHIYKNGDKSYITHFIEDLNNLKSRGMNVMKQNNRDTANKFISYLSSK